MTFFRHSILPVILLLALTSGAWAQKLHPSYKVAEKDLKAIHLHSWNEAVKIVESKSLENLKKFQRTYLLRAPTMDEEMELLRLLGMTEISDLDDMSPAAVFIARGKAKTKRLVDADKHIAEMKKSIVMKTLGTVPEGQDTVHVVIRKEFAAQGKAFSELAFVSVVKEGTVWKVSLDAQEPKVFAIKDKK